ncbi:MAG: FAD:protein FMN transferase, partial [Planctomycetes bacterium]|nr:FAD:protein FMN transferase [Planctomycetota bacterium]
MEGDKKKPQLFAGRRRIGPQSTILLAFIALAIGYFSSNSLAYWLGSGGEARRDFQTMNTYARIVIPSRSGASIPAEQVADLAEAAVRQVNDLMGPYGEHSDVRRLNSVGRNQWISVNPLTWRVVMEALRWHRLSNGAFDPTIWPVKALFNLEQSAP